MTQTATAPVPAHTWNVGDRFVLDRRVYTLVGFQDTCGIRMGVIRDEKDNSEWAYCLSIQLEAWRTRGELTILIDPCNECVIGCFFSDGNHGTRVERCDTCGVFPNDDAAVECADKVLQAVAGIVRYGTDASALLLRHVVNAELKKHGATLTPRSA